MALSPAPEIQGTLAKGSSGPEVLALQNWLIQMGYLSRNVEPSGSYDDGTMRAVMAWQRDAGIQGVGLVRIAPDGSIIPDPDEPSTNPEAGVWGGESKAVASGE